MGQVTLNYNRLYIGWSWKVSLNMLHKPEFVPSKSKSKSISLPRQNDAHAVSSSMTSDMVSTSQEGV